MKQKLQRLADLASKHYAKAGVAVGTMLVGASAFADGTDPFVDAVTGVTTKVNSYGALLVGLSAVGVLFAVAIKYMHKIPRAT